jgi:FkbM family methyltransferase
MSVKHTINRYLRRFNVELHGIGYLQSLAKGDFKKNEYDFFKHCFGNKPIVIFDVGANRGNTINAFFKTFPSAQIYAFEPIDELCQTIVGKFGNIPNLKLHCKGISDKEEEITFYVNKSLDTSSFLPSQKTGLNSDAQVKTVREIKVVVTTIEEIVVRENVSHIHILKLDIQGSELKALKGAASLLANQKIDIIYTEAYFIQQYKEQPLFYDIADFLKVHGYVLQDIYNPIYGQNKLAWCDAVFVRNNF